MLVCACAVPKPPKTGFLVSRPFIILVYFQLTQQLEDIKKVVDGKEADIAKLKTTLDQSGKEMKQLHNQQAKDLEKAASEKEKLERFDIELYYIPINDTSFELSVFWSSDTESRINELRFSESISLSFKTRLALVTCFCGEVM